MLFLLPMWTKKCDINWTFTFSYLMLISFLSVLSISRRLDYSIPSCSLPTISVIALSQLIGHQHWVSTTAKHSVIEYILNLWFLLFSNIWFVFFHNFFFHLITIFTCTMAVTECFKWNFVVFSKMGKTYLRVESFHKLSSL